jgi:hypothetical protein
MLTLGKLNVKSPRSTSEGMFPGPNRGFCG